LRQPYSDSAEVTIVGKKGEELKDAVARECIEEIGCSVEVKDIIHIREYIGKNHEFAEWDSEVHQVEFYFDCSISGECRLNQWNKS
jgi:8-oxo-dGTP pyrophosphatase MutT (NUDIX family)